jgi:hypothetical protein
MDIDIWKFEGQGHHILGDNRLRVEHRIVICWSEKK